MGVAITSKVQGQRALDQREGLKEIMGAMDTVADMEEKGLDRDRKFSNANYLVE
jgi:hypothetical protein